MYLQIYLATTEKIGDIGRTQTVIAITPAITEATLSDSPIPHLLALS